MPRRRATDYSVPTKQRLSAALRMINQPTMADRAVVGYYDELESDLPDPLATLDEELRNIGSQASLRLRRRIKEGEFDATHGEIAAWMETAEPKLVEMILARK